MLFAEEDALMLKSWIVKRIENTYATRSPPSTTLRPDAYIFPQI